MSAKASEESDTSAMSRITALNQTTSTLLRLPAELRNRIYTYTICTPTSIWDIPDPWSYFSPIYGYWMKQADNWANENREAQLERAQNHLTILLVCQQTYAECRLLAFQVNTFAFDSEARMTRWVRRLDQGQRDAVQSLQLKYVWSEKLGFRHGNTAPAATLQERGDRVRGLRRMEVRIVYRDSLARTAEATDELVRVLGTAMTQWKKEMESERPGVHVDMRAVGRANSLINGFAEVYGGEKGRGGQLQIAST